MLSKKDLLERIEKLENKWSAYDSNSRYDNWDAGKILNLIYDLHRHFKLKYTEQKTCYPRLVGKGKKTKSGFTLIEVLISLAIIAILSSIAIGYFLQFYERVRGLF